MIDVIAPGRRVGKSGCTHGSVATYARQVQRILRIRRRLGTALILAVTSAAMLGAPPAQARTYDTWGEVTIRLAGTMTPWEPHRTLGLVMDEQGIDVFGCRRHQGRYAVRVAYASANGRRAFSVLEQPNGIRCVRTTLKGYGRVGKVENLGFTFDIYAKCGKPRCPASSVAKGAIVQSRPYAKGVTAASVRIRATGLTYLQLRWITSGLTLAAFN